MFCLEVCLSADLLFFPDGTFFPSSHISLHLTCSSWVLQSLHPACLFVDLHIDFSPCSVWFARVKLQYMLLDKECGCSARCGLYSWHMCSSSLSDQTPLSHQIYLLCDPLAKHHILPLSGERQSFNFPHTCCSFDMCLLTLWRSKWINKMPLNTADDFWYSWHLVLLSLPVLNILTGKLRQHASAIPPNSKPKQLWKICCALCLWERLFQREQIGKEYVAVIRAVDGVSLCNKNGRRATLRCYHQLPKQNFTAGLYSSSFWPKDQQSYGCHLCLGLVTQVPVLISPPPPFSTPPFLCFHRNRRIVPGAGSVFAWVKSASLMSWFIKGNGNPISPRS